MGKPAWTRITSSQVLAKGPCLLHSVFITPSAANADVTIYDGENATEPMVITLVMATAGITGFSPSPALELERGLYIAIGSNITAVLVQYEPL